MTGVFVAVLLLHVLLKTWLGMRQLRHVARHAHAVPESFVGAVALADHQRAAAYTIARQRMELVEVCTGAVLLALLTWGGALRWLADALAARLGAGALLDVAFVACAALLLALADLPLEAARCFGVEQRFGFNRTTPATFLLDHLKAAVLAAVLGLPLLWLVMALMHAGGALWWLWAWAAWVAFTLALSVLYPLCIAPWFNRFTPLPAGALRERVDGLLARTGFRSNGVFTMDGSRRSAHGNAYFTGLGAAKRIVFFDTLLERLEPAQIEAVLAHELGHFRLRHVTQRLGLSLVAALAWLALLAWLRTEPAFTAALGMGADPPARDGAVLVLFALFAPLFTFALAPLLGALSRRHEYEADAFAARHASAEQLQAALVRLYRDNATTLTPDPLHSTFYDSHPPAALRIAHLRAQGPALAQP